VIAGVSGGGGEIHADSVLIEWTLAVVSVFVAAFGIAVATWFYKGGKFTRPKIAAEKFGFIYRLIYKKYKIDELYNVVIVKPLMWVSDNILRAQIDEGLIDDVMVNGSAKFFRKIGGLMSRLQTGQVQTYIMFFLIGVLILIWLLF
jgi:NADH-quinone oxidoreductase subunit L